MSRIIAAALLIALGTTILSGQTISTQPRFAVASIKPSDSTDPRRYITGMQRGDFRAVSYTLKDLIRLGWDVRSYQISGGPKWLDSDRYNIEVKPEVPFDVSGPGDETNLGPAYDLKLEWSPDEDVSAPVASSGPSIFTALQEQLGLRLEAGKAPVDILVVDYAEKPAAN